jgi:hypothetical protein
MYSNDQLVWPHTENGLCKDGKKNVGMETNGETTDRKTKK